jgi:4-hydroxy-tetrahydrodipicolinate synthase
MFQGTFGAIATPFADGKLDEKALTRLIAYLLDGGVEGIVACGTTGESPTLDLQEWSRVVKLCVQESPARPVLAGTGSNNTKAVIERTKAARDLGAAGALVVTPYYNKPTQAGLIAHYEEVARRTRFPLVMYSVPSRTGVNLLPETVATLSRVEHIVGLKDAAGSVDQFGAILATAAPGFKLLSGDDSLSFPLYALGGHGVISTTAVAAPKLMSDLYREFSAGNLSLARAIHFRLLPLFKALFAETNPAPLKYALSRLGLAKNELRLPLVPVSEKTEQLIDQALAVCGLANARIPRCRKPRSR